MTPYAEDPQHLEENITLLCTRHHTEATGAVPMLPDKMVREANDDPANLHAGITAPTLLHYSSEPITIVMGNTTVKGHPGRECWALGVDGNGLLGFRFEDDRYLLSLSLFDQNNRLLLRIDDNELTHRSDAYDVERTGNSLIVRQRRGHILLHLEFTPPTQVKVVSGRLWWNGASILFNRRGMVVREPGTGSVTIMEGTFIAPCGVHVYDGDDDFGAIMRIKAKRFPYPGDGRDFDAVRASLDDLFDTGGRGAGVDSVRTDSQVRPRRPRLS
ncbi:hypothetical protein D8Y23_15275 [Microbacterium enclense]|uniref:Uncharacterized protein n=2 Tax=Microbacterium enclense TaxID=993073 RepID=A0A443J612_9MICO|nr:hypothetical protein D8Y23_15275 [Microbacterium enclense]